MMLQLASGKNIHTYYTVTLTDLEINKSNWGAGGKANGGTTSGCQPPGLDFWEILIDLMKLSSIQSVH